MSRLTPEGAALEALHEWRPAAAMSRRTGPRVNARPAGSGEGRSWMIIWAWINVATGLAVAIVLLIDVSGRWSHRFSLWRPQASPRERRLGRLVLVGISLESLTVGLRTAQALPDRVATMAVVLISVLTAVPALALLYLRATGRLER